MADLPIDLQQPLFVEFDDGAVVGHQAVELGLAVCGLSVDGTRNAHLIHILENLLFYIYIFLLYHLYQMGYFQDMNQDK